MERRLAEKRLFEKEGVIFLIFKDGKVLLEERITPGKPYYGYRIIPGGKKEKTDLDFDMAAERGSRRVRHNS